MPPVFEPSPYVLSSVFVTTCVVARLPSLCMEFGMQEDLSGFPFPSPDPWTEVVFAALAGGFFTTQHFVHACSVASAM